MQPRDLDLPDRPGVYLFRDHAGKVIYVGKARSLSSRVRSYFQSGRDPSPRLHKLRQEIAAMDYIIADNEIEALVLELNLIKRHRPRFNVKFADDKHYPYLRVSGGEFPRVTVVRRIGKDGARYFGPYTVSGAVGQTLKLARQLFPFRTCPDRRLTQGGRACLYYHIRRCPGPCVGAVSPEEYGRVMDELCMFFEGRQGRVLSRLRADMAAASDRMEYERAAALRDRIRALDTIYARQQAVLRRRLDQDVVAVAPVVDDDNNPTDSSCAQILQIRDGKLVGREQLVLEGTGGLGPAEVMDACLKQYYQRAASVPPEILVDATPSEAGLIADWLCQRAGRKVTIRRPERGSGRALLELAGNNAREHARTAAVAAELPPDRAQQGLAELAELLGLLRIPERIEGYDTSAAAGDQPVASLVVFTDGRADRSGYRRFSLSLAHGSDDLARMRETARRRAQRLVSGDERFGSRPDLVLVDGGATQREAVSEELDRAGLGDIPVVGLAKEQEALYLPGRRGPLLLSRDAPGLQLLQRVRDEAHRFAVTYQRRRRRGSLASALDEIPGIGPRRRRALIERFGSVAALRAATVEEIAGVSGIGPRLAEAIHRHLDPS